MKKLYVVFVTVLLLIIGFMVGKFLYKIRVVDAELLANVEKRYSEIQKEYNARYKTAVVYNNNVKLSPTAELIFKTEYEKCGHILNEYKKVTNDEVNLTEAGLQEKYSEWKIDEFSEKEAVLSRRSTDSCNQHFVIRDNDGSIAVYLINENNLERLQEITNISTKYLTELDLEDLRAGIRVNGLEELNSKLEDFE